MDNTIIYTTTTSKTATTASQTIRRLYNVHKYIGIECVHRHFAV